MPHFKRLEYKCKCINISINYACGSIPWYYNNSEFEIINEDTTMVGHFRTWETNIDPNCLKEAKKEIEERMESFVLAMRFLGNIKFSQVDETWSYITEKGEECPISSEMDIEGIIHRSKGEEFNYGSVVVPMMTSTSSGVTSSVSLPQKMPKVPLFLKRHILTAIQAEELDGYPEYYEDEQLKRWFLIIEELGVDISRQEYEDLRSARNFVSHPTSNKLETIAFLKREIPSSVYLNSDGKEEARYLRDDPTHRAFVSKYQTLARRLAKELVKRKISCKGGYICP